jgi:DNA polymerase III psi subunit
MDTNSEIMLSTADVSKRLKVGSAMVRKWAIAYEAATGDKVKLRSKRDGREFSASQVAVISAAKKYVDLEGVKVETALKMALGQTELIPVALDASAEGLDSLEVLKEFLVRNDETTQLLLEEIRGLREDLRRSEGRELSQPAPEIKNPAQVEQSSSVEDKHHGPLTRAAIWLEQRFRS